MTQDTMVENRDMPAERQGFFKRLRARINRGDSWLTYDLANLVPGGKIDEDTLDELEAELVMADVGIEGTGGRFLQWLVGRGRGENWFAYLHLHDLVRTWEYADPQWDTFFEPRPELKSVPPIGEARQLFFAIPRRKWTGGLNSMGEYRAKYDGALARLDSELGKEVRLARTAPVDTHRSVAARHPPERVHRLPIHVGIGFLLEVRRGHPELVLLVGTDIDDRRDLAPAPGPINVRPEAYAVTHRNLDILVDGDVVPGHKDSLHVWIRPAFHLQDGSEA